MKNNDEGCQRLAAAIVKGAIVDYRKAKIHLCELEEKGIYLRLTNHRKYEAQRNKYLIEIESIEQFIHSPYFGILSMTNPEKLIQTLREEGNLYGRKTLPKSG